MKGWMSDGQFWFWSIEPAIESSIIVQLNSLYIVIRYALNGFWKILEHLDVQYYAYIFTNDQWMK